MMKKLALLLTVIILLYPLFHTSGNSFTNTRNLNFVNNSTVLNETELTKVEFSYLFGSYWQGEVKINLSFNSDNTIVLNSKVSKDPNNGLDSPLITSDIPLNTSFNVHLNGYSVNFTQYFKEANISFANQWNYFIDSSFSSNCNADCQYYSYLLQVYLKNGSSYSVLNQLPYPPDSKTISDTNSEQAINYTISIMHSLINSYNLTKIGNDQIITLTLNSNQSLVTNSTPGFEILSLLIILPYLFVWKRNKQI